jgi:Cof subfamily protein (haloacid dehalogenase superfamily)
MIVTDLDRTLLRSDKTISGYTADVLNRCKTLGIKLAFATARPARATLQLRRQITPDYVIADNGATVTCGDALMRNLVMPRCVSDELIARLIAEPSVSCVTVEALTCMYTNFDGVMALEPEWQLVYTDYAGGVDADTPKVSADCTYPQTLIDILENYPDLHLYSNNGESWHQIMRRAATKTNAARFIAETLGFDLRDVASFGDDYNDVELLQSCGVGVAVSNAVDDAKSAADFVCGANDDDGVARWLDEHVLV